MEHEDKGDVEFSGKASSFKELLIEHLRSILSLSRVEYRGGFYSTYTDRNGTTIKTYVPDTRATFSNATLSLTLLLEPKFDKKMKEQYLSLQGEIAQIEKQFMDASSVEETVILGETFYKEIKDKILLEEMKQKKLQVHLKLFAALSHQLARLNFLEIGGAIT